MSKEAPQTITQRPGRPRLEGRARRSCLALALAAFAAVVAAAPAAAEPSALLRHYGDASSATGAALGQGACDVNGDGYEDAVVGAWFWDKAPNNNIGAAYVLFGGPTVAGGDLNVPGGAGAARIDGPSLANAFVGFSVACVGDVNDDGFDDIGLSHYTAEKAYVVLGAASFGSVDLTLLGDRGFEIEGLDDGSHAYNVGNTLSAAGDVNDDGFDDVAVGGVVADTQGRTNNGRIWIVAGKQDLADVELIDATTNEAPEDGEILATIDGPDSEDRLGQGGLSPAGDVNDDGIEDFVAGAYAATPWGPTVAVPGQAWVLWGDEDWGATAAPVNVDLATIGAAGFEILGPKRQRDRLGVSVSGAGDVNADGHDDVILGGDGVYNAATGERHGSAWVVFGSESGERVYTETDPGATAAVYSCQGDDGSGTCAAADTSPRGYWIQGADSDPGTGTEATGFSLDAIGDVSGDEIPDFAIGAYGYDPVNPEDPAVTMSGAGAVWVVHGKTTTSTQDLATLASGDGYRIDGLAAGDRLGRAVGALGDLDGNGHADFAAGGDFAQRPLAPETPRTQAGEVMTALIGPLNTAVELSAPAAGPLEPGGSLELSATVAQLAAGGGPAEAGTVTFTDGGVPIAGCADVAVSAGVAACSVTLSSPGDHSLGATFSGASGLAASSSNPLARRVNSPTAASVAPPDGKPRAVKAKGAARLFSLTCEAVGGCELSIATGPLSIGESSHQVTALYPARLERGQSVAIALRIPKPARRALRRGARGELTVTVSITGDGKVTTEERRLVLKRRWQKGG